VKAAMLFASSGLPNARASAQNFHF